MKTKFNILLAIMMATILVSCNSCTKPEPLDEQAPTAPSNLVVSNVTTEAFTLSWHSSSDNVGVTGYTVYANGSTVATTTGATTVTVSGLNPATAYLVTVKAIDAEGNVSVASNAASVTTLSNNVSSTWLAQPQVVYGTQFAINQNALSNPLMITINNTSGTGKTFTSLIASFGVNGNAVKMLRYSLNNGSWNVLPVSSGNVTFSNITLQSGLNTFNCYFSIKEIASVANGSALTFTFTSLNDGAGGNVPTNGSFQYSLAVGTVNSSTQATKITSDWIGYMSQSALTLSAGAVLTNTAVMYNVDFKATGPNGAKLGSVKLKNPYGNQIYFDNTNWKFSDTSNSTFIPEANINWSGDSVVISMTSSALINTNNIYNSYLIYARIGNSSTTQPFDSGVTTPGLFGLQLMSKYDLVVYNSDNQVVDLSDVVVKQGSSILSN
jgi:chitodextrinase